MAPDQHSWDGLILISALAVLAPFALPALIAHPAVAAGLVIGPVMRGPAGKLVRVLGSVGSKEWIDADGWIILGR